MRFLVAGVLLVVAGLGVYLALQGPLFHLWTPEDRDSPLWVYMLFGLPPVFLSVGAVTGAGYVLVRQRRDRSSLDRRR